MPDGAPVQLEELFQMHPYSAPHDAESTFALHGLTVPVHTPPVSVHPSQ